MNLRLLSLAAVLGCTSALQAVSIVADTTTIVPGTRSTKFTRFEGAVVTSEGVAFRGVVGNLAVACYKDANRFIALNDSTKSLTNFTALAVDGDTIYAAGAESAYTHSGLYKFDGSQLVAIDADISDLAVAAGSSSVTIDRMTAAGGKVAVVVTRYLVPTSYLGIFVHDGSSWTKVTDNTADVNLTKIDGLDLSADGSKVLYSTGWNVYEWNGSAISIPVARGALLEGQEFYLNDYSRVAYLNDGTIVFRGIKFHNPGENNDTPGLAGFGPTPFFLAHEASASSFQGNGDVLAVSGYIGTYPDGSNAIYNITPGGTRTVLIDDKTDIGGGKLLSFFNVGLDGVNGTAWAASSYDYPAGKPPVEVLYTSHNLSAPPTRSITTDFPGAVAVAGSFYRIDPLDWVYAPAASYPWVYSYAFGTWCYIQGSATNCRFYQNATNSWYFTNSTYWPWYYSYGSGTWMVK